jgi:hypothetical protein
MGLLQPISNDPIYGFKRKVEIAAINIGMSDYHGRAVRLFLSVKYYTPDTDEQITVIPPKAVELTAHQENWVDANGIPVAAEDPTAVMTEYDYYISLMSIPVVINNLVIQKISWADSPAGGNRFDQ